MLPIELQRVPAPTQHYPVLTQQDTHTLDAMRPEINPGLVNDPLTQRLLDRPVGKNNLGPSHEFGAGRIPNHHHTGKL